MIKGFEKFKDFELGMTCQTEKGTKYKTYAVGGVVEEGFEYGHWSTDKDDIWHAFYTVFITAQMINRGKEIKWRAFPEWIEREVRDYQGYFGEGQYNTIILYQIRARFVYE